MPVLEGGASEVGIESTILDLSRLDQGAGPVLLRPGHVSAAQIEAVLGAGVRARRGRAARLGHAQGALRAAHRAGTAGDARVADVPGIGRPRARWRWCRSTPRRPRPMPACNGARCRPIRRATRRRCTRCCASWTPGLCPHRRAGAARQRRMACVNDRIGRPPPPSRSIPPTCSFRTVPPCRHASGAALRQPWSAGGISWPGFRSG